MTVIPMRKRHTDTAPWPEVEPLLAQARQALNVTSNKEVLNYIGYASPNVAEWQQKGVVALRLKYALLGLLADLNVKARPINLFAFNELSQMFAALNGIPIPENQRRALITKLANAMTEMER